MVWKVLLMLMDSWSGTIYKPLITWRMLSAGLVSQVLLSTLLSTLKRGNQELSETKGIINKALHLALQQIKGLLDSMVQVLRLILNREFVGLVLKFVLSDFNCFSFFDKLSLKRLNWIKDHLIGFNLIKILDYFNK